MSSTPFTPTPTFARAPVPSVPRMIDDSSNGQSMAQSLFSATSSTQYRETQAVHQPITPTKDHNTMAAMSTHSTTQGSKPGRFDISTLISPPDAVYDDFSSSAVARILPKVAPADRKLPSANLQNVPPSPPISNESNSPLEQAKHNVSPTPSLSVPVRDPILFPTQPATSRPLPLFGPHERSAAEQDADRIIHEHMRATGRPNKGQLPTKEEYGLMLYFKSSVMQQFQANPRRWLNREKRLLAADRASSYHSRPISQPRSTARSRVVQPQTSQPQAARSTLNRIQKPLQGKEPRVAKSDAPRPIRTSPDTKVRSTIRVMSTPEPRMRTVAPNREDKNFNSVADYCPPLSSLGNKSLRVEWKGNALDLKDDPHAHLLHPEELKLAALLRLDCATYLTSKRRIFESRRECFMRTPPKPFRKTDAQQACKIDVNKASKLWTAYDNVGWLDERWVPAEERYPRAP